MINQQVNGKTTVLGVIGDPISHSFSPVIHNTIAQKTGHNIIYVPFHVKSDALQTALDGAYALGIQGINVTIPHKQTVIPFLHALDESAQKVGSVNTLLYTPQGYVGYNTDYIGLRNTFHGQGLSMKGRNVIILGAGGSSYASAMMAASEQAKKIYVCNRTWEHAVALTKHMRQYFDTPFEALRCDALCDIAQPDIVIQTTALGFGALEDHSPVEDVAFFKKVDVAMDIIYTPWQTKFLRDASEAGCICVNGFSMLVHQAMASYGIWHNIPVDFQRTELLVDVLAKYYKQLQKRGALHEIPPKATEK